MDYLKEILGIPVIYENITLPNLPNYIQSKYFLKPVCLEGQEAVFLYPRKTPEPVATLKKHIGRVKERLRRLVILVLKGITARQKEYLIRERIPFIVEGKQIYLPFAGVYLQNHNQADEPFREEILPSAQMLLLYFIYNGADPLHASQAAKDLSLTPTSVHRATRQLEEMGLIKTRKDGVSKVLYSDESAKDLFYKARPRLVNPVKRTVYVSKEYVTDEMPESSYTGLSDYSMLSSPTLKYYASNKISYWKDIAENSLQDPKAQAAVEMWRYDPRKLSDRKIVDELSLALSLNNDEDERVQEAVEEMLDRLWRKIDGTGN